MRKIILRMQAITWRFDLPQTFQLIDRIDSDAGKPTRFRL